MSATAAIFAAISLAVAFMSVGYISSVQSSQQQLQSELKTLSSQPAPANGTSQQPINIALPVMNQTNTIRQVWLTWDLSPAAHQDRFEPSYVVVNQGDTVQLTLINNDTVAHNFVLGPPYNIIVEAYVPGLVNDLTGEKFTTTPTDNSPGVVVTGAPGNVSATYSFVASHPGVYQFVCSYHASVGMIGYLVVMPNAASTETPPAGHQVASGSSTNIAIAAGSGSNTTQKGYLPDPAVLKLGTNSTVTWTNQDSAPHTVTADNTSFDSGNISPKQSFSFAFANTGTYKYHCLYHPWMTGTITVQ